MKPIHALDDPHSKEASLSLRAEVRHEHHEASDGMGDYVIDLFFKVFGEWLSDEQQTPEEIEVGEVHLRLVRLSQAMDEGASIRDLFDYDQEMSTLSELYDWEHSDWEFAPPVLKVCPYSNSFSDICIIERIALLPWARGQGVGLRVIQLLLRNWQSGCSLAVIRPFPLQGEPATRVPAGCDEYELGSLSKDLEESTRKLTRYYARLGFKSVDDCPYLVRSTEEITPKVAEMDLPECLLVPSGIAEAVEAEMGE